jgi:two-component sensor histidine kinase
VGATVALVDIDDERRLLDEKEVLLGEVNHRVKNSLQIVGAILSLQARDARDEGAAALRSASARVRAVAAVHASLYHDDDVRTVDFGDHLRRFCATLAESLGADARGIALDVEAEAVTLRAETAVPLSLIVNELVTNAFKYAFDADASRADEGAPSTRVRVSLCRDGEGRVAVEVSDNGAGRGTDEADGPFDGQPSQEGRSPARSSSPSGGLGTTLVSTLARQLGATVTREQGNGWTVRITFEA